jgi:hypothetical protein
MSYVTDTLMNGYLDSFTASITLVDSFTENGRITIGFPKLNG